MKKFKGIISILFYKIGFMNFDILKFFTDVIDRFIGSMSNSVGETKTYDK